MSIVTVAQVKQAGRIDYTAHDALIQTLIDGAESFVEERCCLKLSSQEVAGELMDGGFEQLWPKVLPVTAVDEVRDSWTDNEVIDAEDYSFTETRIYVLEEGVWGDGALRWSVDYTAGYAEGTVPKGLLPLIIGLTLLAYDNPEGLTRRGAGGYGVDWLALAQNNNLIEQLDHFSLRRYME